AGTNFIRGAGHHQVMYGYDFERNAFNDIRIRGAANSDGLFIVNQRGSTKRATEYSWFYLQNVGKGVDLTSTMNTSKYPIKRDANFNPIMNGSTPVFDSSQCFDTSDIPMGANGVPAAGTFCAQTQTLNHSLFLRDSWSVLPNLTLNLGL